MKPCSLVLLFWAPLASAYQPPVGRTSLTATIPRKAFLQNMFTASSMSAFVTVSSPLSTNAFEGGVGGLGKTRPETGVVFRNADLSTDNSAGTGTASELTNELLAPDGTPAIVSFDAPWPVLKSSTGVESRDLQNPEGSFLQIGVLPKGVKSDSSDLPKTFFLDTVFGSKGKFGAYGVPTDTKVKKVADASMGDGMGLYIASFTALTPGGRESDRQVYISTKICNGGVFMLVTGTTANRFKKLEPTLRRIAESFSVVAAPKSSLRNNASSST